MTIIPAAVELIKSFESLRLDAYVDDVGKLTIGWGTTAAAGVGIAPKLGMRITEAEADVYLARAIEKFASAVRPAIKVPVNENEFGALVSLVYNIGPTQFLASTVLRRLNAGDRDGAADAFRMWNKGGGRVLNGLIRRREAERRLFLTPVSTQPAPSVPTPAAPVATTGGVFAALVSALSAIFARKK